MYTFLQRTRALSWLFALLVLTATTAQAQVGNYVMTSVQRAYSSLTGDSVISSTIPDSYVSGGVAIPGFNLAGTTCTRLYVTSNGGAQLTAGTAATITSTTYTPGSLANILMPYGSDQIGSSVTGATPTISIRKFGTAPALDSIIVQWKDITRYGAGERISYQMVLIYSTGTIKYVYTNVAGNMGTSTSYQPVVGISSSTTNFTASTVTRTGTSFETWAAPLGANSNSATQAYTGLTQQSTFPANQSYTLTYSTGGCAKPTSLSVTGISATGATLTWGSVAGATSGYVWEVRSAGLPGSGATGLAASGTTASGTVTTPVTGLTAGVKYVASVRSNCGTLSGWWSSASFTATNTCSSNPTVIALASATASGGNFTFTSGTGTNYDWIAVTPGYGPNTTPVSSGSATVTASTAGQTFTVTGLSASSTYEVFLRSNCGATVGQWQGPIALNTLCPGVAVPISENFDSYASGLAVPPCWTFQTVSGTHTNQVTSSYFASSPNGYYTYASSSGVSWLFLRGVNLTAGSTYRLSFKAGRNSTTFNQIGVGVGTSPAAASMGSIVDVSASAGNSYTTPSGVINYDYVAASTGTYYFGVRTTHTSTFYYVSYDDFSVQEVLCGGAPTPTMGTVTSNSAIINWSNIAGATNGYEYQTSTNGGTTWSATSTLSAGATTVTLSSLPGCTPYQFRIRSICPAGSSPYNLVSFTTTGPVTPPFSDGFESVVSTGSGLVPTCWTTQVVTGNNFTSTSTSRTGTRGVYGSYLGDAVLWMPQMALTGGVTYQFTFYLRTSSAGFTIAPLVNSTATYVGATALATAFNPGTLATYGKYSYNFTPGSSGNYYFGVRSTETANGLYAYMDDFRVRVAPTCVEPASVSITSTGITTATGSWPASSPTPGVGYFYKLVAGSSSYTAGAFSGQEGITTSLNQNFGALVDGSTYTLWLRSYCGPGTTSADSSDWISTTFTHVAPIAYSVTRTSAPFVSIGEVASGGNGTGNPFTFTTSASTSTDDNYTDKTNIGFNFVYNGKLKTQFSISTNGRLRLFGPASTAQGSTAYNNYITTSDTNWVMPLWDDLVVGNNETTLASLQKNMKWYVDASGANKKLIAEWVDAGKYNSGIKFGKFQFQVVLEENTNKIYFNYGQIQGFEFVTAANLLTSATVGLTGKGVSATPTAGQIIVQQFSGQNKWGHYGQTGTKDVGTNNININPNCNVRYTFDPAGTLPAWTPRDTTAPSYDDVLNPYTLIAVGTEPTNLCSYTFTSKYATKSDLGTYPSLLPDNATNGYADDDVWFTFQAQSSATTIKMVGSGGMRPAFQLYDASLNPVAGGLKVGTATDYGKVISLALGSLNIGDYYYIRAYHYHGGGQAQATATISGGAITSYTMVGGGSDYNFGTFVTGTPYPAVSVYGDGVGAIIDATALTSNAVSGLTIRSGGSGYTTATIKIDRSGFSPAGQFGLYVFSTPVPPANDLLKNATSVTVGSGSCTSLNNQLTYAATGTTRAAGTDCSTTVPDDDVWYKFVPTEPTLTLKVTPGSAGASMDVAVQIFNAGPTNDTTTMTSVICANGFGNGGAETISGSVTVGNTYYIRVYAPSNGDGGISGRFSVCLYAPTPLKFSFAQSRNTYNSITGGTALSVAEYDSDTASVTLSPGFTYNGTTYTKVWMSTNGYIVFGNNTGVTTGGTAPLSGFIGDGAVAAYAGDLAESGVAGASTEMRYQYVGNEHVFQWKDFSYWLASDQRLSFQIRLNTSTNAIRIIYDSAAAGTAFATTQVGLRASAPTFPYFVANRAATNTWLNTTTGANNAVTVTNGTGAALFPGAGLTFDYTTNGIGGYPVFTGLVGAASNVNYPTFNSARVRWMPKLEATSGYYIRWRKLSDPITVATYATPTSVGATANDTSFTITGLKSSTAYIFDVAARAGADVSGYGPAGSFTTQAVPNDIKPGALSVASAICAGNSISFNVLVTGVGTAPVPASTPVRVGVLISGPASANIFQDITLSSTLTTPASQSYSAGSYTFATAGTYTLKQYVVWAGDQETANDTASTVTTVQVGSAIATAGYKQGFNGPGLPAGYATEYNTTGFALKLREAVNFQGTPSGTLTPQEGDSVLYFNSYSITGGNTASLYTPCFSVSDACSVFKLSLSQNSSYATNADGIEAYVSVNGGAYTQVQLRDSINRVLVNRATRYDAAATAANGRWNQFRIDLGGYNGSTIKIKLIFISQFGDNFAVDNFRIDQRPGNDVGVLAIASPETNPSCASTTTPVTLTVRNYGCNTQSSIPVTISYTGPAGTVTLNDVFDGPIAPGTSVTQTITTIDMTTAGTYTFNATTNLVGDGDAANDGVTGYVSTVNASNLPPTITASITNNAILVGTSATFAATAPANATVSFPNNTNFLLNSTTVYTGTTITVPAGVTGTLPAAASSIAYVEVNGLTTWTGDVTLRLTAPNGSRINLIAARGGSGDNFTNTRFVPTGGAALSSASAPFTGSYAPEQAFSTLTGPLAGVWTLEGIDVALSDATNITSWSLSILNAPVTNTWTASLSNPAVVSGFPISGTSSFSKTFTTAGTYQFTFTSTYANGCSNSLTRTLLVSDGNVWTGTANDQQWNTPGNWAFTPAPPSPGSAVTIPGGLGTNYPTITSSVSTANLTMGSSAMINIGSGGRLSIAGNVSGALSNITGVRAVTFTGPGVQTITGTVTLDSVTVTNTNATGLTFAAGAKLNIAPGGNLRMGTNARITVPANGSLVLKSSTAGTARLLQMPASAQIIGNITMERRTPTLAGWYFVGAPVKTGTLSEWAEMGARVTPKNNSNIFEYTEPDTTRGKYNGYLTEVNGWKVPSALSNPINPTTPSLRPKGYRVYLNSTFFTQQNATLSVTGQPIVGGVAFPFTKTAAGYQGGGWNLASNPYPCEIDWQAVKTDAVAGNSSAPLSDYIQIWNTAAGAYSNYSIAVGIGTNGGSRYIPSSQAFFIRATGNGNLNFRETHKVQQANTFLRDVFPANTLRLTLSDGSHTDQSVVAFRVFGLNGRDQYDADKLNGNYLNVSTMPEPTLNLVANVMGELVAQTEIPVRIGTTSTGTQSMTLSFEGIESFDAGSSLYLRDNYLNTLTDLNQTQLYSFQITNDPASFGDSRFVLVTAPQSVTVVKTKVQPSISVWPNPAEGASQLNVRLANLGNGNAVVTMTDALGREVVRTSAALSDGKLETSLNIQALPTGVYMLRARSGSATIVKEVVIR